MKNRVKNLKIDHLRKVTNRFLDKKEPFSKDKTTGQNADLVLLLKNVKGFFYCRNDVRTPAHFQYLYIFQ